MYLLCCSTRWHCFIRYVLLVKEESSVLTCYSGIGFTYVSGLPLPRMDILRNTGTSKRSSTNPLGHEQYQSVLTGNRLCARTVILAWIAAALACWWLIEQPQGSWMEHHPCFQRLLSAMDVFRHRLTMGSYGAKSEKPTWLYSSTLSLNNILFSDFS